MTSDLCLDYGTNARVRLMAQQQISGDEHKEYYRDNAIHGEESGVQFRKIVGGNERVLISQQSRDGDNPSVGQLA